MIRFGFVRRTRQEIARVRSVGKMSPAAKAFVLMISPGVPEGDYNAPDAQTPFANLFTGSQIGVTTSRLDDVAFYGHTYDRRLISQDK